VELRQDYDASFLAGLPEDERTRALERFQVIRPFLEEGIPVAELARRRDIPTRTAWRWIGHYRKDGLPAVVAAIQLRPRGETGAPSRGRGGEWTELVDRSALTGDLPQRAPPEA
jgi:hypothetical protein